MDLDVVERFALLRAHDPTLRLYALVDGVQYETVRGERLSGGPAVASLFDGTADADLAHAGPWLIDVEIAGGTYTSDLAQLERKAPAVSWLISQADLPGLVQLLQLQLDARLPDGRVALLRFWDPRVLASMIGVLNVHQREIFFAHIYEWHLLRDGRRVHVGRAHADV